MLNLIFGEESVFGEECLVDLSVGYGTKISGG